MKKRIISILLCLSLILVVFSACKTGDTPAPSGETTPEVSVDTPDTTGEDTPETKESYTFGYTCMDGTNPFFVTIEDAIRGAVEANGDKLISADPANDVSLQINQIEDMITQGIDALFLNPAEAEGILPALDMLKEAGIPVLNFDAEVADMEYLISYVGSDNYNAGVVIGEDLIKKHPDGGPIIVLDSPTMNSVVDRTNGFIDTIKDKGFDIVAQQDAKGNLEVSMGLTQDLLQAHGDAIMIFGGNDPTALGALAAANAAGLTDCMIYGIDGSPDIKAEIASADSLIEGSAAQSPVNMALKSVEVMYQYLDGVAIDARYPVETFLITADNVAEFGVDGWQ